MTFNDVPDSARFTVNGYGYRKFSSVVMSNGRPVQAVRVDTGDLCRIAENRFVDAFVEDLPEKLRPNTTLVELKLDYDEVALVKEALDLLLIAKDGSYKLSPIASMGNQLKHLRLRMDSLTPNSTSS